VTKAVRTFRVRPSLSPALQPLATLAANLRWAWDRPTRELFRWADPALWTQVGHNPVELLGRLSPQRQRALAADRAFTAQLARVEEDLRQYLTGDKWAQSLPTPPPSVGYFSPEFGLTQVMQTYSGGLGILAGDHLKAASDLGLEMVGVGLLYRHGYFRQYLDADGWQRERYPDLNPNSLPLRRLEHPGGAPATVDVELAERVVTCQIWKADVGRVPLLLLDTDLAVNDPGDRTVTDRLYGGDTEHRLRQEMVLGIGGIRALSLALKLGEIDVRPQLFHSNEGHAGFLSVERVRRLMIGAGSISSPGGQPLSFDEALESARSSVLFTTHTPVPAGIDRFPRPLMEKYFAHPAAELGVDMDRFMAVGQEPHHGSGSDFNMAVLGLRMSARANGVSRLHGRVSREMFAHLWPDLDREEVPITSVTNGVHSSTWIGPEMTAVYTRFLAPDWPVNPDAWEGLEAIGDDDLWRARGRARERMVQQVRRFVRAQRQRRGERPGTLSWTEELLSPDALTIGFARRFAEYKRGTLLLREPERLRALLLSTDRPVQFVFAGKAHPRDDIGKDLIRQLVRFSADPDVRGRLVFVEDYDMRLASVLYQGVDVWLNNPRRPYEACGTSGEKAVLNGALHCSSLDGWWDEMYDGANGFAIGSEHESDDYAQQDAADAESLYSLLEQTIVPMFYDRSQGPLPRAWLGRVRRSLQTLCPDVLASRMVREYVTELYTPLAQHAEALTSDDHRRGRELAAWRARLNEGWDQIRITSVEADDSQAVLGATREVAVRADIGRFDPADVTVELLHGPVSADGELFTERIQRAVLQQEADATWRGIFSCSASGEYGVAVRILPHHPDLLGDLDLGRAVYAGDVGSAG
jgi:glycogen phosphorylase